MSAHARRLLVVGCGKRVLEAALPALQRAGPGLALRSVLARKARTIEAAGVSYEVAPLADAREAELADIDLVYLAVGKNAVPDVLARLLELGLGRAELLIETPVVRFRHFRHVARLREFRRVSVAEDCAMLPWFDALAAAASLVGRVKRVELDRSAYAYHAVATARELTGGRRVRSARRIALAEGAFERRLFFDSAEAWVREPRDYPTGRTSIVGERATVRDHDAGDGALQLTAIVERGLVRGFRLGDAETRLDDDEAALTAGDAPDASITARQEAMKRVGFLRIWRRLAAGEPAHPLALGLEDMVVDYALERAGRYVSTPFTRPDAVLGRGLFGLLSRLGG